METKHTPGPWNDLRHVSICGQDEAGLQIGFLSTSSEVRRAEGLANAKLIAAAPDLLEALDDLLSRCESLSVDGVGPQKVAARQAISKATA